MYFLLLSLFILSSCFQSLNQGPANKDWVEQTQKDFRYINKECSFEKECFESNATSRIDKLCSYYKFYNFVSTNECKKAGQNAIATAFNQASLAIPNRDTDQQSNSDMYVPDDDRSEIIKGDLRRQKREEEEAEEREAERRREARERERNAIAEATDAIRRANDRAEREAEQRREARERNKREIERAIASRMKTCDSFRMNCQTDCDQRYQCQQRLNEAIRRRQANRYSHTMGPDLDRDYEQCWARQAFNNGSCNTYCRQKYHKCRQDVLLLKSRLFMEL